jgi:hypothetical protein
MLWTDQKPQSTGWYGFRIAKNGMKYVLFVDTSIPDGFDVYISDICESKMRNRERIQGVYSGWTSLERFPEGEWCKIEFPD